MRSSAHQAPSIQRGHLSLNYEEVPYGLTVVQACEPLELRKASSPSQATLGRDIQHCPAQVSLWAAPLGAPNPSPRLASQLQVLRPLPAQQWANLYPALYCKGPTGAKAS